MYAQLLLMTLGPGMQQAAELIADQSSVSYKTMKGFVSATFLGEPEAGEYSSLILWESLEDLQAASQIMRPKFEQAIGKIVKGPPSIRIYEVYQPN